MAQKREQTLLIIQLDIIPIPLGIPKIVIKPISFKLDIVPNPTMLHGLSPGLHWITPDNIGLLVPTSEGE